MTGTSQEASRRPAGRRPILLTGAMGTTAPLALAALGDATLPASVAASAIVAVVAIAVALSSRRASPEIHPGAIRTATAVFEPTASFGAMLEALVDPVLLVEGGDFEDPNARRFVFANSAARELLRIQRREGPLTTALRSPEVLQAVDEALFGAVVGEATYESGSVRSRVWRARAAPLRGDGPAASSLALLTLRDETEIRRSERTRADFLANASHELRTPLASLSGFIETLRGHARDDPAAREKFLAIMHDQAERMRRLIDDLMSLSRIELGEHIPPSGEVDVALAARDVLDALSPLAQERGIQFAVELGCPGEAVVQGDRDQVVQVVQNLAENALKYTPLEGVVRVEVLAGVHHTGAAAPVIGAAAYLSLLSPEHAPDRRYVALRIRDPGPGIAREHLPRLTERFYRVEGQKSGERAGTGLGLAIVKHIMNRHRGGLTVESADGAGSIFTALFPSRRIVGLEEPVEPRSPAA